MAKITYTVTLDVEPYDVASQLSAGQLVSSIGEVFTRYLPHTFPARDARGYPHTYKLVAVDVKEA